MESFGVRMLESLSSKDKITELRLKAPEITESRYESKEELLEALRSTNAKEFQIEVAKRANLQVKDRFVVKEKLSEDGKTSCLEVEYKMEVETKWSPLKEASLNPNSLYVVDRSPHPYKPGPMAFRNALSYWRSSYPTLVFLGYYPETLLVPEGMFVSSFGQYVGTSDYGEFFNVIKEAESLEEVKRLILPLFKVNDLVFEYSKAIDAFAFEQSGYLELHGLVGQASRYFRRTFNDPSKVLIVEEGSAYRVTLSVNEESVFIEEKYKPIGRERQTWKVSSQGVSEEGYGYGKKEEVEKFLSDGELMLKDLIKYLKKKKEKIARKVFSESPTRS